MIDPTFPVTIGNTKETGESEYYLQATLVAYHQNASNCFWSNILAYAFTASVEEKYARDIEIRIEESLYFQSQGYKDMIIFDNAIMSERLKKRGDQRFHYNIKKWIKGPIQHYS